MHNNTTPQTIDNDARSILERLADALRNRNTPVDVEAADAERRRANRRARIVAFAPMTAGGARRYRRANRTAPARPRVRPTIVDGKFVDATN